MSKQWSTAKKNRARDRAAALGDLQNFVMSHPVVPAALVIGFFGFIIGSHWFVGQVARALGL